MFVRVVVVVVTVGVVAVVVLAVSHIGGVFRTHVNFKSRW